MSSSLRHHRIHAALQASAFLLILAFPALSSEPGSFDRTLPVTGTVTLDIRSDPGGLSITAGSANVIRVRATIKPLLGRYDFNIAEANIRALEKDPPIEQVGSRIRIGYPKDPALLRAVTIYYEVEAPPSTQLIAATHSGGIRVDGISGPAETRTSSGRTEISNVSSEIKASGHSGAMIVRDAGGSVSVRNQSGGVQISNIHGGAKVETTSGRIEIRDVAGEVQATTNSAGINIHDVKSGVTARNGSGRIHALQIGGSVHAETGSGEIRISQMNPAPIRALARSGAIKVTLATGGGYQVDAQSDSGRITCRAGTNPTSSKNAHTFQGQIGSGGPLVHLDTHSSQIEIN